MFLGGGDEESSESEEEGASKAVKRWRDCPHIPNSVDKDRSTDAAGDLMAGNFKWLTNHFKSTDS